MKKSIILSFLCASMMVASTAHGCLSHKDFANGMLAGTLLTGSLFAIGLRSHNSQNVALFAGTALASGLVRYVLKANYNGTKTWGKLAGMVTGMATLTGMIYKIDKDFRPAIPVMAMIPSFIGVMAADRLYTYNNKLKR